MRIVDLSVSLSATVIADPPGMGPSITYLNHEDSLKEAASMGISKECLPEGQAWAIEHVALTTHNGTHLDAPWHCHPTMNRGERAWTIDEVPLHWCFRPGLKLDFRDRPDGYVLMPSDIEGELARIRRELNPLDIVLINTSASQQYGSPDYPNSGCGMGKDATLYLTERGVRIAGTDAWSWDAPFKHTFQRIRETKDYSRFWEGHKSSRDIGFCHIEKLTSLERLPSFGFYIACFPIKVERGSAGWCRAVAVFFDLH